MHTPGPWKISKCVNEPGMVKIGTGPDGWLGVAAAFGDSDEEVQSNALLIAAAPNLLAACKAAMEDIPWGDRCAILEAAILSAE
jgi:hypothetical protein